MPGYQLDGVGTLSYPFFRRTAVSSVFFSWNVEVYARRSRSMRSAACGSE